jgi:very-short-patch-repair endonuclease
MDWLLIIVVLVVCAILVGLPYFSIQFSLNPKKESYRKYKTIMSSAEWSFYAILNSVLDDKMELFAKVRVADVLAPDRNQKGRKWRSAFNKIANKHFDYVLCDTRDFEILCVIELDDESHREKKHTDFLNSACESAGLRLLRFNAQSTYSKKEVKALLSKYFDLKDGPKAPATVSISADNVVTFTRRLISDPEQ